MRVLITLALLVWAPTFAAAQTCVTGDNQLPTRIGFVVNWAGENCRGIRRLSDREFAVWFEQATGISDARAAPG